MRGNELLDRLELVDPAFIEAADRQSERRRPVWQQFGALAACLCAAAAAVFAFRGTGWLSGSEITPPPAPPQVTATADPAPSQDPAEPEPPASAMPDVLTVDMGKIFVNEIPEDGLVSANRLAFDPELYDENVPWDSGDVAKYYGRPLAPAWVPEGLTPTNPEGSTRVVIRKSDGAVVWDTVHHGYYQVFGAWEDGSPRTIDERCVSHGFSVAASRVGLTDCCVYHYDEEIQRSDIGGVPVTIGYSSMSHGPYDPDTHVPAGYYDLYVAEFTLDGIQFRITADEMSLEEVVKITASVICPDREIDLAQPEA